MFRNCIVLAALALCGPARGERAVLECTADTWIAPGDGTPRGREQKLVLSDRGAVLLEFRMAAVEGWKIDRATLLLHAIGGKSPRRIRVAPVPAAWSESGVLWRAVRLEAGRQREVRPYQEEWVAVEVGPEELKGRGIALRGAAARFSSRESTGHAPYLLVEGSARMRGGPAR